MCVVKIVDEADWRDAFGITHSGRFHADEVFATVMLARLFRSLFSLAEGDCFTVCRTRDERKIAAAVDDGFVVYDVGGQYDVEKKLFDHHQKDFDERRKSSTLYATAGLIWKTYGPEYVQLYAIENGFTSIDEKMCQAAAETVDCMLIEGSDAQDNGVTQNRLSMSVSSAIEMLNPTNQQKRLANYLSIDKSLSSTATENAYFLNACMIAKNFLDSAVANAVEKELERKQIIDLLRRTSKDSCYLFLNEDFSCWREIMLELSKPKNGSRLEREVASRAARLSFCVFPRGSGESKVWCAQAIPPSKNKMMEQRESFPKNWRGLKGEELERATGVKQAIFCHANGFFVTARTSLGAMTLATYAHELNKKEKARNFST